MTSFSTIKKRYHYSVVLLRQLIITDFKLRYQGSILGYAWSLLRPLLLFLVLFIVFDKFLKVGGTVPHYPVYLLVGIVLWNFFAEVTAGSVAAVVNKGDLIRKLNFPKYIIVLAVSASAVINLGLNAIIIAIFMIAAGTDVTWMLFPVALIAIGELLVFALAIGFILSALFVKLRDVGYIWEVILQVGFYATPILYPLALLPLAAQHVLLLNPVAQVIQDVRRVLVSPEVTTLHDVYGNWAIVIVPPLMVLLVATIAVVYFRKRSKSFAEEV